MTWLNESSELMNNINEKGHTDIKRGEEDNDFNIA